MILESILIANAGLMIWAAISDGSKMIIPNWIPLSIFGLFLLFQVILMILGENPDILPFWSSLAVGFSTLAILTVMFALKWMGGGDVKLISAIAFWAGTENILEFLVVTAMAGGILSLFFLMKRKSDLKNSQNLKVKKQVRINKKERKRSYVPYGIAISIGGLFVVNNILTFLLA